MALFKVSKGLKANLPSAKTEGYCWYTTDDSLFYIDYKDENGTLQRKALNAKDAETLTGASLSTILNSSDVEIPTSKAVSDALDAKLDKADAGSDWNQNDSTQPDYVKNRPFYEETEITPILESQQIDFSQSFRIPTSIVKGNTYLITWDGTDYTITATEKEIIAGEIYIPYLEQADGLFSIEDMTMRAADNGIHTVAISLVDSTTKTIDEKFIPSSILNKMDALNPVGKGSFSLNRSPNFTTGDYSFAECYNTVASGNASHAEGYETMATGSNSHAEGSNTIASEIDSHAEGQTTTSSGAASHAEGNYTIASGAYSHAEGDSTIASGENSHAEGEETKASSDNQHVQGKFNIENSSGTYAHIVGNGTSDTARSNAHTLDWSGNAWYAGKVSIGTTSNVPTPTDVNDLVTKQYVDNKFITKTASVTLAADSWTGTDSPYSQVVTIDGVTANSKVDLNPTGEQLNSIATNRTILNTSNDNGTVTVYAVGNKPTEDYTMQVTITEV